MDKAFCIPNHVTSTVFRECPWEFKPTLNFKDKGDLDRKLKQSATKHCVYSYVEGEEPGLRANKENPGTIIHACVVDYDAKIDQTMINTIGDRAKEYMPSYISRTVSGNARVIYEFETPVHLPSVSFGKLFMRNLKKKLKLGHVLPGLDEPALDDIHKYYELGSDWVKLSSDVLSTAFLTQAIYEVGGNYDWKKIADVEIPLKDVIEEIDRKWPGRWLGTFEEGARSVVPFNPASKNPMACIARKTGLQTFGEDQPFYSWKDLFGSKFVEKYITGMLGVAIEGIHFDGRDYWRKSEAGVWNPYGVTDISRNLRIRGLNSVPGKNETASDIDLALHRIQEHNTISTATPMVHRAPGLMRENGELVLNVSNVKLIKPDTNIVDDVTKSCPFLIEYLNGFFDPAEQLDYFLAWFKRWYESALAQNMVPGQAVFISGPVGVGKTFLSNVVCSLAMGGHRDATKFLMGDVGFNDHLFERAVWTVDDSLAISKGKNKSLEFSANVKRVVASHDMEVSTKFRKSALATWNGRLVTTLNDDPESQRILPEMDINIRDKVMLFRASKRKVPFRFPSPTECVKIVRAELPAFLRWLVDWTPPPHTQGTSRFGVVPYHEQTMIEETSANGLADAFRELLEIFMVAWEQQGDPVFSGSATKLLSQMEMVDEIPRIILNKYTSGQVARRLVQLEATGYPAIRRRNTKSRYYEIDKREIDKYHAKNKASTLIANAGGNPSGVSNPVPVPTNKP